MHRQTRSTDLGALMAIWAADLTSGGIDDQDMQIPRVKVRQEPVTGSELSCCELEVLKGTGTGPAHLAAALSCVGRCAALYLFARTY